jgi:hypothetical protein
MVLGGCTKLMGVTISANSELDKRRDAGCLSSQMAPSTWESSSTTGLRHHLLAKVNTNLRSSSMLEVLTTIAFTDWAWRLGRIIVLKESTLTGSRKKENSLG